ncbi:MAG: hypothetical protein WAP91_03865 [Bacilli bacterium]
MYVILNLNYHGDVVQLVCNEEQLEEIKKYIKMNKHLSLEELLSDVLGMFDCSMLDVYSEQIIP